MRARKLAAAALALLALAGCAPTAQKALAPVQFHAEGLPPKLSDWHVVQRMGERLALNQGVVPYDLATPLFTDYAHKLRTLWVPPGKAAAYDPQHTFDFPVGTIISKTFYYPRAGGAKGVARTYDSTRDFAGEGLDLDHVRLIETRLLVRREAGWVAIPYVWNAAQDEAEVYDRTVDVQVRRLRMKIEADSAKPALIVTERGAGYRLASEVETLY